MLLQGLLLGRVPGGNGLQLRLQLPAPLLVRLGVLLLLLPAADSTFDTYVTLRDRYCTGVVTNRPLHDMLKRQFELCLQKLSLIR